VSYFSLLLLYSFKCPAVMKLCVYFCEIDRSRTKNPYVRLWWWLNLLKLTLNLAKNNNLISVAVFVVFKAGTFTDLVKFDPVMVYFKFLMCNFLQCTHIQLQQRLHITLRCKWQVRADHIVIVICQILVFWFYSSVLLGYV